MEGYMTMADKRTPDEIVAERIVTLLIRGGVINKDGCEELLQSLARGEFTAQDWRLLAEKELLREKCDGQAH
jgi:hypothetical protein